MSTEKVIQKERTHLRDRAVEMSVETRPIEALRLDPSNPRLHHVFDDNVAHGNIPTEKDLEDALWSKQKVKELSQSVIAVGGLQEPLYIKANGTVVEGNERLTALRRIAAMLKDEENTHFKEETAASLSRLIREIPVRVLPSDIREDEISILLAQQHVGGKDQWDAYDQAHHIYNMSEVLGIPNDEIARHLRKSRTWVQMKLAAYKWAKDYFDRFEWDTNRIRIKDYSFFEELYKKRARLRESGLDVDSDEGMRLFQDLITNREITAALDVRNLPLKLQHEETRQLVLDGHAREADRKLKEVDPAQFSTRFAALDRARLQLRKLTRDDLEQLQKNRVYRDLLAEVSAEIDAVLAQVQED